MIQLATHLMHINLGAEKVKEHQQNSSQWWNLMYERYMFHVCVALRLYGGLIWILVMCAAKNMGEPDSLFGPMSVIFQQPWGSRYDPIWHAEKLTHQFLSTYIFVSGEAVVEWIPLQFHVIVVSKKQEIHLQDMPRNTSVLPGSPDVAGVDHQIFRMERVQWLLFTRTLWRNTAHDDDAHEESLISTLFSPHNCLTGQIIQPVCVNSFQPFSIHIESGSWATSYALEAVTACKRDLCESGGGHQWHGSPCHHDRLDRSSGH